MTLLQNMTQVLTGANMTDQAIASDMLAAGKMSAISLTLATLEAVTPELRHFFQETLNECLSEHERLFKVAQERGWYKAFASPDEQLQMELQMSEPLQQALQS